MWLSGLHVPESYLIAVTQTECRKNGWSLDHSTLYTTVTNFKHKDEIETLPKTVISNAINTNLYLNKNKPNKIK